MFVTALAPNTLALSVMRQTAGVTVTWLDWFVGFAPVGFLLLLVVPWLLYRIYPPEIRSAPEAPRWAAQQLEAMGAMTRKELTLLVLVCVALALWIGAIEHVEPAISAMLVVLLMVGFKVVSWNDVIGHAQAWNVLVWFATMVTLAGGLGETKFLEWLAQSLAPSLEGFGLALAIVSLVSVYFFLHYFFASITAHAASMLPVFIGIAIMIPGLSAKEWALLLAYPLGLMGVLTTYTAGHNPIYYGSGYITRQAFWGLGITLGVFFLIVYLAIAVTMAAVSRRVKTVGRPKANQSCRLTSTQELLTSRTIAAPFESCVPRSATSIGARSRNAPSIQRRSSKPSATPAGWPR